MIKKILVAVLLFLSLIVKVNTTDKDINILALGDSITYGYGISQDKSYSYLFYDYYKNQYQDFNFNYINKAVNGFQTSDVIKLLDTQDVKDIITSADIIFISIGSNNVLQYLNNQSIINCLSNYNETCQSTTSSLITNIDNSISSIKSDITTIITNIRKTNNKVMIVVLPYYNPYNNINLNNISFVNTKLDSYKNELNLYLKDINDSNVIVVTDLVNELESVDNLFLDVNSMNLDPHPNITGHQVIANTFINNQVLTYYFEEMVIGDDISWVILYIIGASIICISLIILLIVFTKNKNKKVL
ncbi:MAG: SGNH/GDSL hydrolase family protein [bacterium]|nr:SGNH/GDSL hydrolase family protein [bacterium]